MTQPQVPRATFPQTDAAVQQSGSRCLAGSRPWSAAAGLFAAIGFGAVGQLGLGEGEDPGR